MFERPWKKQYPYTTDLIQALYHAYGPERLMLVRDRLNFLSDEDRQWRLRKSAERVFFRRG